MKQMKIASRDNTVYLDTCIISGLAKNDLVITESRAMLELLKDDAGNAFDFVTSSEALDEINRIPEQYRIAHLAIYYLLENVRAVQAESVTRLAPYGGPMSNPLYQIWTIIRSMLPDVSDARHIYGAHQNGSKYFLTVDQATILKHRSRIEAELGMIACKPSELINLNREHNYG